jgi:2-methylcitrate dehydratase PrpD
MLRFGRAGLEEFTDAAIQEAATLELAAKVRYELDPTIDYPRHFSGHVKVFLDDGTVLEENQPHPRGGLEDPLPPAEIEAKFRANASLALPAPKVDSVLELVAHLEELPSIAQLSSMLMP